MRKSVTRSVFRLLFNNYRASLFLTSQSLLQCPSHPPLLRFQFTPGVYAPFYPDTHRGCIGGCDPNFMELLGIRPLATQPRNQNNTQPSNTRVANDSGNSSGYASGSQYSANSSRSSASTLPRPQVQPRPMAPNSSNNARSARPPIPAAFSGATQPNIPSQPYFRQPVPHPPSRSDNNNGYL
jgi:hypothetical protein